jgi:hypothetical protein
MTKGGMDSMRGLDLATRSARRKIRWARWIVGIIVGPGLVIGSVGGLVARIRGEAPGGCPPRDRGGCLSGITRRGVLVVESLANIGQQHEPLEKVIRRVLREERTRIA